MKFFPSNRPIDIRNPVFLFLSLQIYFVSNTVSFGFWKSNEYVFEYMLLFYGAWLIALVLLLVLILFVCRRLNAHWVAFVALTVLSFPFAFELWVRSIEIDDRTLRYAIRLLLVPVMYYYFRFGLSRMRVAISSVFLLCAVSFISHAGLIISIDRPHNFESFSLNRKPNIHVIMLDALTHSQFTQEFMGIGNPAADLLEDQNDAIYAGTQGFSEFGSTKATWGTLFNLGKGKWARHALSGMKPNRLAVLLRSNGYTISTGFSDGYFGWQQGKWVDQYYRGGNFYNLRSDLACVSGKGKLEFCKELSQSIFSKLFIDDRVDRTKWKNDWPDKVIRYIDEVEKNESGPLFSAYHIYVPGHAPKDFDIEEEELFQEFINRYSEGLLEAKSIIDNIDRLRKRHPNSIFIISGDHGTRMSSAVPKSERRFITLDNHAVALSMLNASNLCPWSRNWLSEQQYLTPTRMLVAALVCDPQSRQLTEHFVDDEDFLQFSKTFGTSEF